MKNEKIAQESAATEAQVNKINYTSKTTNSDFVTEVGNFTSLALANSKSMEDVIATISAVGEAVKGFRDKKKVDLSLGNKVTVTLAPVGGTTNLPTTHAVIAKALSHVTGSTVEIVRNETKGQTFQITSSNFVAQFVAAILPYALLTYDKFSRKFIDGLKDVTSVKREKRKEYTVNFAKAAAMALVRGMETNEELISKLESELEGVATFSEKKEKPAKKDKPAKKEKSAKEAKPVEADPVEEEGTVVYKEPEETEQDPVEEQAPKPEEPQPEYDDFD
jgi:hypothetical protein